MVDHNDALINESRALMDVCNLISSRCYELTKDDAYVNDSIIRSIYTLADALGDERNNLLKLLDEYKEDKAHGE